MIDCKRFQEVLADLDRPDVLPAELRGDAFAHAEGCSDCGHLLTETELLDAELRRLAARVGDADAPAHVEDYLLKAFRQRKLAAERKTAWRYASAVGIAAVLLLGIALWLNRRTSDHRRLPGLNVSEPLVAVGSAVQVSNSAPSATHGRSVAREKAMSPPAIKAMKRGAASAEAFVPYGGAGAGFIPLPDADPGPLDDGAVVRVEMPRAALASFGLPVEAMEGGGTVLADLIVSADGTPQAIRLLSQSGSAPARQ
jgi:hypothetical protein